MELAGAGFSITADKRAAVAKARQMVVAVQPRQLDELLAEIRGALDPKRHTLVSVVTGVSINQVLAQIGSDLPVVRAIPNTAIAIGQSMTCLTAPAAYREALAQARALFDTVGATLEIDESITEAATALCACGVAFFLR